MLTLRSGSVVGLIAQIALLVALAMTVGLSGSGWIVGVLCGALTNAAVARGLARRHSDTLGPADLVTLTRATLAGGVAALVTDSFLRQPAATTLVALTVVALILDAVDGWLARRTRTASMFGARFDGEVDAFLILVLSVYVAASVGGWVLAIGAARYVFAAAGWGLPWLREQLPPRYWRKVVAATQGVVLTVAAADVAPRSLANASLMVALALLTESFGRDVWWLWRHRSADSDELAETDRSAESAEPVAGRPEAPRQPDCDVPRRGLAPGGSQGKRAVTTALTHVLALLLVWFALVAPNHAHGLTAGAFLRIPVEGLVVASLAIVLHSRPRRVMAAVVGVLLGLVTIAKLLDMAFYAAFDRPFNVVTDRGYLGPAFDFVRDSNGPVAAVAGAVAAGALVLAVLVGMPVSVERLTNLAARRRRWSVRTVTVLAVVWAVCAVTGLQVGQGEAFASSNAGRLAVGHLRSIAVSVREQQSFDAAAEVDDFRDPAAVDLLSTLRGKDVVVAFVESYGRTAIDGSPSSAPLRAMLDAGTRRLQASGYSSQSGFLTSPTFGGLSWLAHATLQSGLWVDNQQHYDELLSSNRMTLSRAFNIAGWQTVAVMPSNTESWPEGKAFYQFDQVYDRRDIDYQGPEFGWSSMPDQYALSAFHRLVFGERGGPPVMAEINLSSSHRPWTPLPRMIDWSDLGDGSVFDHIQHQSESKDELRQNPEDVEAAYVQSIAYSLGALISFVKTYGDDDLVLVIVGDHQPATIVSGHGASRDVPIAIVAHDRAVVDRISGWGWQDGLRPDSRAPVWPMDAFRDRFLAAFSPRLPPGQSGPDAGQP